MAGFNYVSCIKIAGAPILPPLVTEKDRGILAYYKKKAIQKEKELLRRKSQHSISKSSDITDQSYKAINDSSNSDLDVSDNSIDTERVMDFIRQALQDVGHTDVELLQSKILEEMQKFRSASCDTLHLLEDISLNEDKSSFDLAIESSASVLTPTDQLQHHNKDTLREENNKEEEDEDLTPKAPSSSYRFEFSSQENVSCSSAISPQNIYEENLDTDHQTPPKLIRRNSYTLDSPSPSVLQYLRSLGREHSDCSSPEITNGKKVVKNLNHVWEGSEIDTLTESFQRISPGGNNNFLPIIPAEMNDKNSNILLNRNVVDRAVCTDDEHSENVLRKVDSAIKITPEKLKAIIIIQAGIRGYLIRRLMKTNKVMELRNTIKDSLICALALHSEQNVSTADVNLHVRLIRQVTAACYELHAIFFEYTPQEKMHLISIDREKLLSAERAKMNLRRLKGIKSDDENQQQNGIRSSVRGKPKRPLSLPLTRRGNSLNRSRR